MFVYSPLEISMYSCERYYFNHAKDDKHAAFRMLSVLPVYVFLAGVTAVDHLPVS